MGAEHERLLYALKSSRGEPTPRADPSLGIDAEDLDGLVAALKNPAQRPAALQALGNLRDKRAFGPVLQIFQSSHIDIFTRECAARILGELRDPRAVEPLVNAFRMTPNEMLDQQLTALLGTAAGKPGSATLNDLLGSISIADMIDALEQMLGSAVTEHLQETLRPEAVHRGISERLNHASRQGLLTLGEVALPGLFDALKDPDPNVRREVASTLCYARGREVIFEHLVGAFDDSDPSVRAAAATCIEQLFDPRAVDPLIRALQEDADSNVRTRAARSLGIMAARGDTDRIIEALRETSLCDADARVRREALQELDRLRPGQHPMPPGVDP